MLIDCGRGHLNCPKPRFPTGQAWVYPSWRLITIPCRPLRGPTHLMSWLPCTCGPVGRRSAAVRRYPSASANPHEWSGSRPLELLNEEADSNFFARSTASPVPAVCEAQLRPRTAMPDELAGEMSAMAPRAAPAPNSRRRCSFTHPPALRVKTTTEPFLPPVASKRGAKKNGHPWVPMSLNSKKDSWRSGRGSNPRPPA